MLALLPLAALAPLLTRVSSPAPSKPVVSGKVGAELDQLLERCVPFGFSGSALVIVAGKTVLAKGYGLADPATARACSAETLYDIGSLTKQFTASAVLRLEAAGKLAITDSIEKHVGPVPADKRAITLEQLLTHTSGIDGTIRTIGSATVDREEALAKILAEPLASRPGTRLLYSNTGYDLLAIVVEKATGKAFEDVLREELWTPAGLEHTGFCQQATLDPAVLAVGFEDGERVGTAAEGWYSWALRGAGGVITSIEDLARWEIALQKDVILGKAAKAKLFAPRLEGYACGWRVRTDSAGRTVLEHGGTTQGFEAHYTRFPEEKTAIVVLANNRSLGPSLPPALARVVHGEPHSTPPAVAQLAARELASLAGEYELKEGALVLAVDEGGLMVTARGQDAVDALLAQRSDPASCARALSAAKAFVGALREGDAKKIESLLIADHFPRALRLLEVWPLRAEKHGPLREVEPLGWVGAGERGAVYVRLGFERGTEILRLGWTGERIDGVLFGAPCPIAIRFQPETATRFLDFELFSMFARRHLSFDPGTGRAAAKCTLEIGGARTSFERRAR